MNALHTILTIIQVILAVGLVVIVTIQWVGGVFIVLTLVLNLF